MRSCALILLGLLVSAPAAHAESISLFSITLGPDVITFELPTSPTPVIFPYADTFTLPGIAMTDLNREFGRTTTTTSDISFYAAPDHGCYCLEGGLGVLNAGAQGLNLDLSFGYYNDPNSSFFTGTVEHPTFKSGYFATFNQHPSNSAWVQITTQDTPVPEPSSFALVGTSLASVVLAAHRRRARRRPHLDASSTA